VQALRFENYLKQLYLSQQDEPQRLWRWVSWPSDMAFVPGRPPRWFKALADSGLVSYEPRGGVRLTRAGGATGSPRASSPPGSLNCFLVKVLGLDWSEVHAEAKSSSTRFLTKVLERIDSLLGHPSVDPHGEPDPAGKGPPQGPNPPRKASPTAKRQVVPDARVLDQGPEFLQFADRCGLVPAWTVALKGAENFADISSGPPRGARA